MSTYNDIHVVGMHFRGAEAKATVAAFEPPVALRLEREPENPYDANAIKVYYGDQHIGYIEKSSAAFIALDMDAGIQFTCTVEGFHEANKNTYPVCTVAELIE